MIPNTKASNSSAPICQISLLFFMQKHHRFIACRGTLCEAKQGTPDCLPTCKFPRNSRAKLTDAKSGEIFAIKTHQFLAQKEALLSEDSKALLMIAQAHSNRRPTGYEYMKWGKKGLSKGSKNRRSPPLWPFVACS